MKDDFKMTVKVNSPLYRDILGMLLAEPSKDWVQVTVIRAGEGKQTRYSVE